jgi:monovalent cation/hydrogen antiporter
VNTVISFTVPFLAAVPSELLGASGLVAAVVAGLVTGQGAARRLSPQHRQSDAQNWRTIELILEGAVFLVMGLELSAILSDLQAAESRGIAVGWRIAAVALVAVIAVRALYVLPTLSLQRMRSRRGASLRPRLTAAQERGGGERFRSMLRRKVADIDYFTAVPLGWREGTVIVWAGMRGAVTLAAAQTLPHDTPDRSLIVFIAFVVAAGSLIIQGGTLPLLVRLVKPAGVDHRAARAERTELFRMLRQVAAEVERSPRTDHHGSLRLEVIEAQREALLAARRDGAFSGSVLTGALETLDAEQISIELRGEHHDEA